METNFRTAYSTPLRVSLDLSKNGKTKQSFKEECDINTILAKYKKTGVLDFVNENQAHYGDVTGIDFRIAMIEVAKVTELFDQMPGSMRSRFQNDPAIFLEFIQDPENRPEAIKLGLIQEKRSELPPEQTRRVGDSSEPPAGSDEPSAKSSDTSDPPGGV